jgi:hypothetical protein
MSNKTQAHNYIKMVVSPELDKAKVDNIVRLISIFCQIEERQVIERLAIASRQELLEPMIMSEDLAASAQKHGLSLVNLNELDIEDSE